MQIAEVTVGAGRTFNHPFEQYSNLRPSVTFRAVLQEGDDAAAVAKELQAKAEQLVEDHKQFMLSSLRTLHYLSEAQRRLVSLESQIKAAQSEVEALRKDNPQLALPIGESPNACPECSEGTIIAGVCDTCGHEQRSSQ
jgi:hypothetical protein